MRESITFQEFEDAFLYLQSLVGVDEWGETLGLTLPYDVFPGSEPGGIVPLLTRSKWEAYQWNPPQHLPNYTTSQANVSAKPTWEMIVDAIEPGYLLRVRPLVLADLSKACRRRITAGYGETNTEDEGFARLQSMETGAAAALVQRVTAGNAERDRLRARHLVLKTQVNDAATKAALDAIDITADATWAAV